ncbi:glycosyltransferase family 2 protein [Pleurocapsa sp. PCC 7319]|uniref:glycosyltransferase family 2 protein n=1 Tax=Pleurocapsa sp. PCC 7319 TaxID=118161 RepID=UPI00034B8E25|nr:glycosyltransferase family 2 protein [Pleurocapsa sp. PCC 7319]
MNITVIIPTYRRPQDLVRCLNALKNQTRPADEVLIIVRDTDAETWTFLKNFNHESLPLRNVKVTIPGQVAALNAGLDEARSEIISITDDDAAPRPEWLARIESHFLNDSQIGGVGGRDWLYIGNKLMEGERKIVGKVQWFGRTIGEHHRGIGKPREVEILKGANMSYRQTAIANLRFDKRLLGSGAEVHNDLAFALNVKKSSWKLIYDPLVEIDHYQGLRFDEDRRGQFNEVAWFNEVHNQTLVLLEYLPTMRKVVYLVWTILVGTRKGFGVVQLVRFFPKEGKLAGKKWLISMRGRWQGLLAWREGIESSCSKLSQTSLPETLPRR